MQSNYIRPIIKPNFCAWIASLRASLSAGKLKLAAFLGVLILLNFSTLGSADEKHDKNHYEAAYQFGGRQHHYFYPSLQIRTNC